MGPTAETPDTTERPQTKSGSKDDTKHAATDKPKADAKEELRPDAKRTSKDDLKSLPMADLQAKLQSSPQGLTQAEAAKRLTQDGPNALKVEKSNAFLKFLGYFWGPIPWMIEAAVILSGAVRHWLDFFIILALLFSNALVSAQAPSALRWRRSFVIPASQREMRCVFRCSRAKYPSDISK